MKDIMGIEIENMSAASAVRRIMGLLAREPLSVCTVLRAEDVYKRQDLPLWKKRLPR